MLKPQLYLWSELRKKYVKELTDIKDLFFDRVFSSFDNIEQEADKHADEVWENIGNQLMKVMNPEDIDPSDYAEDAYMAGVDKYLFLSLMRYRTLGIWISLLCQVWEQQIHVFILTEASKEGLEYNKNDVKKGFIFDKAVFLLHDINFEKMKSWSKIKELRFLVNTIKHGDGDSANKLRKLRPDYFNRFEDGTDSLILYQSSLLEETLKIEPEDFTQYYNTLVEFWNELPERMYMKDDIEGG